MSGAFLDRVYDPAGVADSRALYAAWAEGYEAELKAAGYAAPDRVAAALRRFGADPAAPVLDYGCGTGLSGEALRAAGFAVIDGLDVTAEMVAIAAAKGLYRRLEVFDPAAGPTLPPAGYAAAAAVGVVGRGAAPPETIDLVLPALRPGGLFAFTFNDQVREDPAFAGHVAALVAEGRAELLARDYGPHLPQRGVGADVYVLRRT